LCAFRSARNIETYEQGVRLDLAKSEKWEK
jgi:hypothetical protein